MRSQLGSPLGRAMPSFTTSASAASRQQAAAGLELGEEKAKRKSSRAPAAPLKDSKVFWFLFWRYFESAGSAAS